MKWLLTIIAVAALSIGLAGCSVDPTEEYNKGHQEGRAEGYSEGYNKGYRVGYNERHQESKPQFGKATVKALSIGMFFGGFKIIASISVCILYISMKRGLVFDPLAKAVAAIVGALVSFIVFKFTDIEVVLVNASLYPAWSNGYLLLFGTAIFFVIGYYFTSWMRFLAVEVTGIGAEAWCVFLLSASASAIGQVMYSASTRAVDATTHAGGFALLGILVGGLAYYTKLLVGFAEAEVEEKRAKEAAEEARAAAHAAAQEARRLTGPKR